MRDPMENPLQRTMPPPADAGTRALLSVVVPCLDEEAVIAETHRRLAATLEQAPGVDFEIVYVDDGSRDATLDLLRGLQRADGRVRVLALSRNFGQQMAQTAGLAEAAGDAVVVIDADLQDPPEIIPEMLERWRRGADVVYGVRAEREGETVFKRWTANAYYRLQAHVSDIPIPLDTGDFRLMDRKVVDVLRAMPERDRIVRFMTSWAGFRQEPIHFQRPARAAGETKYSAGMMLRLAMDGILSFSPAPLRLVIWLGFLAAGLALSGIACFLAIRLFTDAWVGGWATLLVAILFLGGVQLVVVGVLGEYLARIYGEVKHRPLYLVRERLGFPATSEAAGGKATTPDE